jgi:hypothetical protein
MQHKADECEACQLNLILYGESYVNAETGEHYDLPTMLRIQAEPLEPMVEAFKARHGL